MCDEAALKPIFAYGEFSVADASADAAVVDVCAVRLWDRRTPAACDGQAMLPLPLPVMWT